MHVLVLFSTQRHKDTKKETKKLEQSIQEFLCDLRVFVTLCLNNFHPGRATSE